MNGIIYVALGGAIGASLRHMVGHLMQTRFGTAFPYGTITVNILGSFLMGLLIGWMALRPSGGQNLRLFLAVGLLGGFTTFSAFSLDVLTLFERKAFGPMMLYIGGSVILSLVAIFAGLAIARKVFVL